MRFDVKDWGELDRAVHDYREKMTTEPLILVLHTPGQITYRFIVGDHGIERQECTAKGDALSHDL
jgi:hypothetical protein